jgi:hypothetical protein
MSDAREINIPKSAMSLAACKCGSLTFRPVFNLLCYKGFLSEGKPLIKMVQLWQCSECNELLPMDLTGYPMQTIPVKELDA